MPDVHFTFSNVTTVWESVVNISYAWAGGGGGAHSELNQRLPEPLYRRRVEAQHHHGISEERGRKKEEEGGREGAGLSTRGIWKGGQRAKRQRRGETRSARLQAAAAVVVVVRGSR